MGIEGMTQFVDDGRKWISEVLIFPFAKSEVGHVDAAAKRRTIVEGYQFFALRPSQKRRSLGETAFMELTFESLPIKAVYAMVNGLAFTSCNLLPSPTQFGHRLSPAISYLLLVLFRIATLEG
jgi:hypothetical protein